MENKCLNSQRYMYLPDGDMYLVLQYISPYSDFQFLQKSHNNQTLQFEQRQKMSIIKLPKQTLFFS